MAIPAHAPIAPIQGLVETEGFLPASNIQPPSKGGFGSLVVQGLETVNRSLQVSQADLQAMAVGNPENLHQIMIRLEETRMSFQLFMQVRNRLLEAYQDIMKMPV